MFSVIFGNMGSGKTDLLISTLYDRKDCYEEDGIEGACIVIAPLCNKFRKKFFDCEEEDVLQSRSGSFVRVDHFVDPTDDLFNMFKCRIDCTIYVDEFCFLTAQQIKQLKRLSVDYEIDIMLFGLKCDYKLDMFEASKMAIIYADEIEFLEIKCSKCNYYDSIVDDLVHVTDDDYINATYEPRCFDCYFSHFY
jgi:thymidine kinase